MGGYNKLNLVGRRFGKLLVLADDGVRERGGQVKWLCKCDCGNIKNVNGSSLIRGITISCGCNQIKIKHGHSSSNKQTRTYNVWLNLKKRCYDNKHEHYKDYGDRGIKVCDRWRDSFENFLEDMGKCPDGMSIERINNDGDYCLENCRWATFYDQCRNKPRQNIWVVINDELIIITDALKLLIIPSTSFYRYMHKNNKTHQEAIDYYIKKRGF